MSSNGKHNSRTEGAGFGRARNMLDQEIRQMASLTPTQKVVASHILRRFYNAEKLRAWPSQRLLASELNLSERTVRRVIKTLECNEILLVDRRSGDFNCYRFPKLELALSARDETPKTGHVCPDPRTRVTANHGHQCPPNPKKNINKKKGETPRTPVFAEHLVEKGSTEAQAWDQALNPRGLGSLDTLGVPVKCKDGVELYVLPYPTPPKDNELPEWRRFDLFFEAHCTPS